MRDSKYRQNDVDGGRHNTDYSDAVRNLKSFWQGYFEQSNAELKGFGTPELTVEVE